MPRFFEDYRVVDFPRFPIFKYLLGDILIIADARAVMLSTKPANDPRAIAWYITRMWHCVQSVPRIYFPLAHVIDLELFFSSDQELSCRQASLEPSPGSAGLDPPPLAPGRLSPGPTGTSKNYSSGGVASEFHGPVCRRHLSVAPPPPSHSRDNGTGALSASSVLLCPSSFRDVLSGGNSTATEEYASLQWLRTRL